MIVKFGHVLVDDQDKALRFYTETLGFVKKRDVPDGESGLRFLTVESPDGVAGFELELQAADTEAARTYQQQFKAAGFAYAIFSTNNIQAEVQRLKARGVTFLGEPEDTKFDDTCGNLVNLLQIQSQPRTEVIAMILNTGQVLVDDQDKALRFYTEKLGFVKVTDMPDGDSGMRFLVVESPDGIPGVGLELMGTYTAAARAYQQSFRARDFAFTLLCTNDIQSEYQRLKARGVHFIGAPEDTGPVWTVKFDDTCGNLINLIQFKE